ncbi:TonB-dependent receptor [Limibacterium fermenti]|uniref:TonB-dependent receptor n=1 Tax=Limibacterium fermenti TaxID=3229863 RepID=UPI000E943E47|nr:hypothetical protein [Porphyromonadaceae bacterium]
MGFKSKSAIYIFSFLLSLTGLFAQRKGTEPPERMLDTVFVIEKAIHSSKDVNAGSRVSTISSEVLEANRSRSLAELLADNSVVHIKSMGVGALSTASFRGSSSSQTRVNWNGINITPVMAGIFDFSQIPVFFADKVSLYYGSNDVKSGTGAIGGSVNIFNTPVWNSQTETKVSAEYGSYNSYTGRILMQYGSEKSSFKTRLYHQHSDNDYTYINKILTNTPFREKRADANYDMTGLMQEAHFRLSDRSIISSAVWYQQGKRMLPQPLGVVETSHEQQKEYNLRAYAGWNYYSDKSEFSFKIAYISYRMKYDKWFKDNYFDPQGNTNQSKTGLITADYTLQISPRLKGNTSMAYQYDMANAESYRFIDSTKYKIDSIQYPYPTIPPPELRYRNVFSWQTNLRWQLTNRLLADARYMFEWNNKKRVSTYSVGLATEIIPKSLYVRGSGSYNYRFPSMNELYWRPGGNPDVLPEHGHSYDATLSFNRNFGNRLLFELELAAYYMLIDDWILWLPTDKPSEGGSSYQNQWLWTPQNKRDVRSVGGEVFSKLTYQNDQFKSCVAFNYSYTRSRTRKKQHVDDGSFMKQIPYVPKQKWNVRFSADYEKFFFSFQVAYVGVRYITTDQSYYTPPYTVYNTALGYTYRWKDKITVVPQLRIDNLFDTYYESTQYYPMPLRNILASVVVEL